MRKTHLQDTKHLGPACQNGRSGGALRGEHITVKFSEFNASEGQCERCKTGKLFAFLQRRSSTAVLNIGLDGVPVTGQSFTNGTRNPPVAERLFAAIRAVRISGFVIRRSTTVQSDTEPTLVVEVDDADRIDFGAKVHLLSIALHQDCIAVYNPITNQGRLIGRRTDVWGPFNPKLFFTPDGTRLA